MHENGLTSGLPTALVASTVPWKLVSGEQKQNRFFSTFVPFPVRIGELIFNIAIEVALGP